MRMLYRALLGLGAAAFLAACSGVNPSGSAGCTLPPRDVNQALAYAHSLGIPSSLDDAIEVLGCTRGEQDPLEGPIAGYDVYGEQQFREDKAFLEWLAERIQANDLSLSEAERLVKRFAADPETEGKDGSYGNITSLEWKIVRENWVLWEEANRRGLIPSDAVLTVENLIGVFLSPVVNLTHDPLTPLAGPITVEGVQGYASTSYPAFGEDENGFFYNILGTDLVTILEPTDPAIQRQIAGNAEYWYQGFDTRVDVPSSSGIFCADLPDGGVDTSKYPPVYNTLLIPGKVSWLFSQEGAYRPGVWDHQITLSFDEVPKSLIPSSKDHKIRYVMPHFTTLGVGAGGETIHEGSLILPARIDDGGILSFRSYLGKYLTEGTAITTSCYVNYDYNWYFGGPNPENYVVGGKRFRNGENRYTLPIDPLNFYVHSSGIGIAFAAPHIFRLRDGTLFLPTYYGRRSGATAEGMSIIEAVPTRLSVPYPTPRDPFEE